MPGIPEGILMAMQAQKMDTEAQLMRQQAVDTQAQAALRQQQTEALKMEMDAYRRKQAADLQWQQLQSQKATEGNPTQNEPTPSVAEQQQLRHPDYRIMDDLQARAKTLKGDVERARNVSMQASNPVYMQNPEPFRKEYDRLQDNYLNTIKEMQVVQDRIAKRNSDQAAEVTQLARNWKSPEDVAAGVAQIRQTQGDQAARFVASQMPMDPMGNFVWNPSAQRAAERIAQMGMKTSEQLTAESQAQKVAHDQATEQAARDRNDRLSWYEKAEIAAKQQGLAQSAQRIGLEKQSLEERRKYHQDILERSGYRVNMKELGDVQKQVDKVANEYKIEDYRKGLQIAQDVEDKLSDPKQGYAAVSAPNARALVEQGKLMMDNFRSRTGGKYQDAQINSMNSVLDKLEKYATTIGEGDKLLAKDVMLSTTKVIKQMALDRNADMVKDELGRAAILKAKGQDPTLIHYRGDIDSLVSAGKAKQVTKDGKTYLVFGKNKSDIFEMPSAPEKLPVPSE